MTREVLELKLWNTKWWKFLKRYRLKKQIKWT